MGNRAYTANSFGKPSLYNQNKKIKKWELRLKVKPSFILTDLT